MKELATTHPVSISWRSFELRPAGSPPIPPEYRARIDAGRPQLYAMAKERYGVTLNQGPFGQDSRPALVGAKFAEAHGLGDAYHNAVFRAYWEQAQPIEEPTVLIAIATAVGLDAAAFQDALADPGLAALVDADIALAAAYQLSGVPAMVFASRYLVSGAQPSATLREVVERIGAEQAQ